MTDRLLLLPFAIFFAGSIASAVMFCIPPGELADLDVSPATTRDVGLVRQGAKATGEFRLTNRTSGPVHILQTAKTCGCVQVALSKEEIAPNDFSDVAVTVESGDRRGDFSARVIVVYSGEDQKKARSLMLSLQARIDPDYDVTPEGLAFGGALPTVQRVTLRPRHIPRLTVTGATCNRRFIEAHVVPTASSAETVIQVTFRPADYYADAGAAAVLVDTDSRRQPTLQIPVEVASNKAQPKNTRSP